MASSVQRLMAAKPQPRPEPAVESARPPAEAAGTKGDGVLELQELPRCFEVKEVRAFQNVQEFQWTMVPISDAPTTTYRFSTPLTETNHSPWPPFQSL